MKNKKFFIVLFVVGFLLITACLNNYGTKLDFNGGELYYTESITENQAENLGNFLIEAGFYNGEEKTVQITKVEGTYQFRMVSKDGVSDDETFIEIAGLFATELSKSIFENAQVEVHFCDNRFETLRIVEMK